MKLFYANINSIYTKKHDLETYINSCLPDIICLNETLMTDRTEWQEYDSGLRKYKNNYHILKDENVNKLPNTDHKIVPFRGISIFTLNDSDSSLIQKHDDFEIVAIKFKTHRNETFVSIFCYFF